jgi:hypothetical protein
MGLRRNLKMTHTGEGCAESRVKVIIQEISEAKL